MPDTTTFSSQERGIPLQPTKKIEKNYAKLFKQALESGNVTQLVALLISPKCFAVFKNAETKKSFENYFSVMQASSEHEIQFYGYLLEFLYSRLQYKIIKSKYSSRLRYLINMMRAVNRISFNFDRVNKLHSSDKMKNIGIFCRTELQYQRDNLQLNTGSPSLKAKQNDRGNITVTLEQRQSAYNNMCDALKQIPNITFNLSTEVDADEVSYDTVIQNAAIPLAQTTLKQAA